jgi:hypothetical protein
MPYNLAKFDRESPYLKKVLQLKFFENLATTHKIHSHFPYASGSQDMRLSSLGRCSKISSVGLVLRWHFFDSDISGSSLYTNLHDPITFLCLTWSGVAEEPVSFWPRFS